MPPTTRSPQFGPLASGDEPLPKVAEMRALLLHRAKLEVAEPHRNGFVFKSYETFVLA